MAKTSQIAWAVGSGNITLTYTGAGDGSAVITSDANDLYEDREQTILLRTTSGEPEDSESVLVRQGGKTIPVGTKYDFEYTGTVQEITLPKGKYKLQCWGAQGGNVTGTYAVVGSKGGYSEGVLTLTETTTLYVFVGGQGTSYTSSASQTSTTAINGGWNGGGAGVRTSLYNSNNTYGRSFPRGGGGATDIALVTSSMSYSNGRTNRASASLLSRIIVAGGGAGASARKTDVTTTSNKYVLKISATSSTLADYGTGYYRNYLANIAAYAGENVQVYLKGGTRTDRVQFIIRDSSGAEISRVKNDSSSYTFTLTLPSNASSAYCQALTLDKTAQPSSLTTQISVQEPVSSTSTSSSMATTSKEGGGTSGKGQYPGTQTSAGNSGAFGLGASASVTNYRYLGGGGGGGWYGGGTAYSDDSVSYIDYCGGGSGFVNTAANASARPSGYTGLQLDSGTTIAGSSSFESPSGGTETGHSGNGYARITVL